MDDGEPPCSLDVPEEVLPTPMDESAHIEDFGRMPPSIMYLEGKQCNAFVMKEERHEALAVSSCKGWQYEDVDRLPCAHVHIAQATTVVVKEDPGEILPTPTGDSVRSEDCGGIPTFTPHLEAEMCNTIAVKEELEDVSAVSSFEAFYHGNAHCLSSSHDCQTQDKTSSVVVKEDPVKNSVSNSKGGCPNCEHSDGQLRSQELREHEQKGTRPCQEVVKHRCRFCTYASDRMSDVTKHERKHTGERPFTCEVCQKTFKQKPHLRKHLRIHSEPVDNSVSNYEGESCDHEDSNGQLRFRELQEPRQNGTRPCREGAKHRCQFCAYASDRTADVTRHERTHTGERPFACGVCRRTFTQKFHLTDHMRIHSEPEKILPTPTGEREHSEDCCGISAFTLHLEGGMPTTIAVKEELDDLSSASTFKASYHKGAHCLSSSHDHQMHDETSSAVMKEESEDVCAASTDACAPSTFEGFFRKDASCLYSSHDHRMQVETSSVVVKEEPVDNSVSDPEGESSNREDCNGQLHFEQPQERLQNGTRPCQEGAKHQCRFCTYASDRTADVTRHERTHTGERPFACEVCRKTFKQKTHLWNHLRTHSDCTETEFGDDERLDSGNDHSSRNDGSDARKQKMDQGQDKHRCRFCAYTSYYKVNVTTHERVHTGEKPFSCVVCHKAFASKPRLMRHERVHTGETPFKCSTCGSAFRQQSSLAIHKRIHTGERPFSCLVCHKAFTQKSNLLIHERVHTGEKPFSCRTCPKSFTKKSDLVRHETVHTGERPFKCETCEKAFSQKSSLSQHQLMSHV